MCKNMKPDLNASNLTVNWIALLQDNFDKANSVNCVSESLDRASSCKEQWNEIWLESLALREDNVKPMSAAGHDDASWGEVKGLLFQAFCIFIGVGIIWGDIPYDFVVEKTGDAGCMIEKTGDGELVPAALL